MSKPFASELVQILRMFVYTDRKRNDSWIRNRSLYAALAQLIRDHPNKARQIMSHPEDFCQLCGGPNCSWFAANDLWNKVIPNRVGILCPVCFVDKAIESGFPSTGWQLVPENPREDAGRE